MASQPERAESPGKPYKTIRPGVVTTWLARRPDRLLLAAGLALLLIALWAGWIRLGWPWPPIHPTLPVAHGPLMVSGFLGTLIALERAVALRSAWAYLAPAFSAGGGLALLAWGQSPAGPLLITLGSVGLAAIFVVIVRRHPAAYTRVMVAGALAWLVGNLLWLGGRQIFEIVLWWAGFLILTIAGERLELSRLVRMTPTANRLFLLATAIFASGLALTPFNLQWGTRLASAGMLALAAWLLRYDIARRTVRKPGLPRFAAVCLLSGYFWLGAAGITGLVYGAKPAGPVYDAFLHSVFVGYVISMIFGHAPIIFPAILKLPVQFTPILYAPLALLHLSLFLRIGGDLGGWWTARLWGGLLNGIAMLLFFVMMGYSARRGGTQR